MAKRKRKKKKSLVGVIMVCFVLFCSVKIIGIQVEISQKEYQLEQVREDIEQQKQLNSTLEGQITKGIEDKNSSIERAAFEQYGYGYPDEHVYIDSSAS